jgi:hypothetical protein
MLFYPQIAQRFADSPIVCDPQTAAIQATWPKLKTGRGPHLKS